MSNVSDSVKGSRASRTSRRGRTPVSVTPSEETLAIHTMPGHIIRRMNQWSTALFSARMERCGIDITSVQFAALFVIREKAGLDQASLASAIAYDRVTIGGVVDRLEQKGYLTRAVSQGDRRARTLTLSEQGARILARAEPEVLGLQSDILCGLSKEERDTVLTLLQRALDQSSLTAT